MTALYLILLAALCVAGVFCVLVGARMMRDLPGWDCEIEPKHFEDDHARPR